MTNQTDNQVRIEALEARNAFQDDVIDQLNDEIAIHQKEIAELKYQLTLIASRLKERNSQPSNTTDIEPPPPHY